MKPTLVVHIGTPKTGTSSIQRALFEARGQLRSEAKILYASTDRSNTHTKHLSVTRAATGNDATKAGAEFRALMSDFERSGANMMIVSEEELSAPKERISQFFKRFVPHFDIRVVCYLRRQDYFIESLYNQIMRMRGYQGIPPITEFWRDERFRERLHYHRLLSWWADIPATVVALDFAKEVKDVGLLPSFLRAIGREDFGELPDKAANTSSDMRLLLTLCMLSKAKPDGEHQRLMQGLMRAARSLELRGVYKPIKHTLGSAERELLISTCEVTNEALAEDFGVQFGQERPSEGEEPILAPDAAYLMNLIGELSLTDGVRFINRCRQQLNLEMEKLPAPEAKSKSKPKPKSKPEARDQEPDSGQDEEALAVNIST